MAKKIFICLSICVILCMVGCDKKTTTEQPVLSAGLLPSTETRCKLIVKGNELDSQMKFNYEYSYAEIPILAVIKNLGAEVEWQQNKTTAEITFKEKKYILDTEDNTIFEEGKTFNFIVIAPGSKHSIYSYVNDNEFIIDSDSAKLFFTAVMGVNIKTDIKNGIVNIE